MKLVPKRWVPERGAWPTPFSRTHSPASAAGKGELFLGFQLAVGMSSGTDSRRWWSRKSEQLEELWLGNLPRGRQLLLHLAPSVTAVFISSLPGQALQSARASLCFRNAEGRALGSRGRHEKDILGPLPGILQRPFSIHPAVNP